jgi:hypothetical protein
VGATNGDTYLDHTFAAAGTFYLVLNEPITSGETYTLRAVLDN